MAAYSITTIAMAIIHRHFMGKVEKIEFRSYEALLLRFQREIEELWRSEDEKR
jgi:hypothetical protein